MATLKNPKHERFAQELAKGKTADEAQALAGYSPNRGNAQRMKSNESILSRVDDILSKAAQRTLTTIEDIARQLDEDRAFARQCGSASAAVAASLGKAKILGLIVDKTAVTGSVDSTITFKTVYETRGS